MNTWICQKAEKVVETESEIVILTVIGALGTVLKGEEKRLEELEIRGRIETIQIIKL